VVIRTAKEMAGKIEQPADLWDLESYLTQSRNQCCGLQSVPGRFPLQVVSGQFPEGLTRTILPSPGFGKPGAPDSSRVEKPPTSLPSLTCPASRPKISAR
jgi:hypothetical protein